MSSKRTVSTFGGPPRRCGLLDCKALISGDDPHTVCISCLGVAHAFNALKYPDAPDHCDTCSHYSERFLRSRYEAARAFAGLSPEPHRGDVGAYEASGAIVAYRRDRRPIREAFDDHLSAQREVTYQRVVNVVERRTTTNRSEVAYDRGYDDDQRYYSSRNAPDQRGYRGENTYPPDDRSYMDEHLKQYPSSRPIPQLEEPPYGSPREDFLIRRQVEISSGRDRAGPYVSSRGQGLSPLMTVTRMSDRGDNKLMSSHSHTARGDDYDDYPPWRESSLNTSRDRSPPPPRREVQTSVVPSAQGSGSSSRSYTPERDTGYTYQQLQQRQNPRVPSSHTPPPSGSAAGSPPHSSMAVQEELPASVKEPENDVMVLGSTEPKLTPEEDLKARRAKAITAKAFEIEKLYRQDCETFGTVVKMLADKEPALEQMLKAPLTENLLEIKQRCLDDLSHFIKELDQAMELDQAIQPSEVISV